MPDYGIWSIIIDMTYFFNMISHFFIKCVKLVYLLNARNMIQTRIWSFIKHLDMCTYKTLNFKKNIVCVVSIGSSKYNCIPRI